MEELEIYQSEDGSLELSVTVSNETVWLSQYQMQTLFGRERSVNFEVSFVKRFHIR